MDELKAAVDAAKHAVPNPHIKEVRHIKSEVEMQNQEEIHRLPKTEQKVWANKMRESAEDLKIVQAPLEHRGRKAVGHQDLHEDHKRPSQVQQQQDHLHEHHKQPSKAQQQRELEVKQQQKRLEEQRLLREHWLHEEHDRKEQEFVKFSEGHHVQGHKQKDQQQSLHHQNQQSSEQHLTDSKEVQKRQQKQQKHEQSHHVQQQMQKQIEQQQFQEEQNLQHARDLQQGQMQQEQQQQQAHQAHHAHRAHNVHDANQAEVAEQAHQAEQVQQAQQTQQAQSMQQETYDQKAQKTQKMRKTKPTQQQQVQAQQMPQDQLSQEVQPFPAGEGPPPVQPFPAGEGVPQVEQQQVQQTQESQPQQLMGQSEQQTSQNSQQVELDKDRQRQDRWFKKHLLPRPKAIKDMAELFKQKPALGSPSELDQQSVEADNEASAETEIETSAETSKAGTDQRTGRKTSPAPKRTTKHHKTKLDAAVQAAEATTEVVASLNKIKGQEGGSLEKLQAQTEQLSDALDSAEDAAAALNGQFQDGGQEDQQKQPRILVEQASPQSRTTPKDSNLLERAGAASAIKDAFQVEQEQHLRLEKQRQERDRLLQAQQARVQQQLAREKIENQEWEHEQDWFKTHLAPKTKHHHGQ